MSLQQDCWVVIDRLVKTDPSNGDFYYLLGLCQTHLEFSHEEAERNFRKAIELKPWSSDPVYALGILYKKQNKKKQAARCFERVMSMTDSHHDAAKAIRELYKKKKGKKSIVSVLTREIKIKKD